MSISPHEEYAIAKKVCNNICDSADFKILLRKVFIEVLEEKLDEHFQEVEDLIDEKVEDIVEALNEYKSHETTFDEQRQKFQQLKQTLSALETRKK